MNRIIFLSLAFFLFFIFPVNASDELPIEVIDFASTIESVAEISDEELIEAEPSDLPEEDIDDALTERMYGRMLLDIEGNGEVYYVDPVTGGKEYLADGASAHRLLKRRALGITEENFSKLELGENIDDLSVCDSSELGNSLKGRIVLRVEENGEAYWIYPENCRAYYAGTYEKAYGLMRDFSLGITKNNLAKIQDNKRQQVKTSFRYGVYAYAEDNDLDISEARETLKDSIESMRMCMKEAGFEWGEIFDKEDWINEIETCANEENFPIINKERRMEIKETIREIREEKLENNNFNFNKVKIKNLVESVKERIKARIKNITD